MKLSTDYTSNSKKIVYITHNINILCLARFMTGHFVKENRTLVVYRVLGDTFLAVPTIFNKILQLVVKIYIFQINQ